MKVDMEETLLSPPKKDGSKVVGAGHTTQDDDPMKYISTPPISHGMLKER